MEINWWPNRKMFFFIGRSHYQCHSLLTRVENPHMSSTEFYMTCMCTEPPLKEMSLLAYSTKTQKETPSRPLIGLGSVFVLWVLYSKIWNQGNHRGGINHHRHILIS